MPTSMSMSAVEVAVAVAPAAVLTVASREEEAARVTAEDAAGIVASSAVGGASSGNGELSCHQYPCLGGDRLQRSGQLPDGMRRPRREDDRLRRR